MSTSAPPSGPVPRASRPDRRQEGLRPRPVRRLHRADQRPAGEQLPDARGDASGRRDHDDRRARRRSATCTRCRRRSSATTAINAAIARPARSARPSACSTRSRRAGRATSRPILPTPRFDDSEISERMSGNLCRCAAYPNIVDAIREVAEAEPKGAPPTRRMRRWRGGSGMKTFTYEKADTPEAAVRDVDAPRGSSPAAPTCST